MKLEIDIDEDYYKIICKRVEKNKPYHSPYEYEVIADGKPIEQEPKTVHCKDCKWWKDSDGVFRRGFRAESQCPMNRIEVFEGNGYCYMFEPQESEDQDGQTSN